jgi:hypothetical protein
MNMIEKIARALATEHYAARFDAPADHKHVISNVDANWRDFEAAAKTALRAMREETPTRPMELDEYADQAVRLWNARIDKALDQ